MLLDSWYPSATSLERPAFVNVTKSKMAPNSENYLSLSGEKKANKHEAPSPESGFLDDASKSRNPQKRWPFILCDPAYCIREHSK